MNTENNGLTAAQTEGMSATERVIREKGLTAPRVTPADIEAAIVHVRYMRGSHGIGAFPTAESHKYEPLMLLTLCILVTTNGFTVVGKSACASAANFDEELGRRIALEDAKRQLWPLLGYALRERLAAGAP